MFFDKYSQCNWVATRTESWEFKLLNISIKGQNRGAKRSQAIFFCVDAKFFPYALFVADQVVKKYFQLDFDICLFSCEELPSHPLIDDHNIRVLQVDADNWNENVPVNDSISFASYLRIFIPFLMRDEYSRMWYLDADVFYRKGDLNRLLKLDLLGRPVGAVRDLCQLRHPNRESEDMKAFGLPFHKYFNAGVMLIDIKLWNEQEITEKSLKVMNDSPEKLLQHDQTTLNVVLRKNWAEMSMVWNYLHNYQTMYFAAMFDVCFHHFVGGRKPFNLKYGAFPRFVTEEYRIFFNKYFPNLNIFTQAGLEVGLHKREHLITLLSHLGNFKKFLPNDERFLSDWDVRKDE
jgi:lipopolysaccharide biosynthesis glycosyltransferase